MSRHSDAELTAAVERAIHDHREEAKQGAIRQVIDAVVDALHAERHPEGCPDGCGQCVDRLTLQREANCAADIANRLNNRQWDYDAITDVVAHLHRAGLVCKDISR